MSSATPRRSAPRPSRFARLRRDPFGLLGLLIVVVMVLITVLAPLLAPYDPLALDYNSLLQPSSPAHLLGTDDLGRDLLSRLMWGGRETLRVSLLSTLIGMGGGLLLGMISGYFGGWLDDLMQRVVEIFMAFPTILFLLTIIAVLGPGLETMLVAAGFATIPIYTRLIRGSTLAIRNHDFVEASRALGATPFMIIRRHVLPNVLPLALTYATLGLGTVILATAGLSYIGLGAQPPSPEWGAMLNAGRGFIRTAWWLSFFPGAFIFLTVLGVNLLGESLRSALDPRLR